MGLDRNALMRDGLRLHGSVVYPGIRALSAEKPHEGSTTLPLGYNRDGLPDLLYKPDVSMDRSKPTNGYLDLYKSPPPSLHRGPEGLDRRGVGPGGEKPSELGLGGAGAGAGGYLRLPWGLSRGLYPEAGLYPYMDSSKYAALSMYKAQFLNQPSPYLPQHLAYQSLCASQGGNMNPAAASAAERLYYMPPYPPSPISSPLVGSPMRIPAVSVAPTSIVHCQEKGLSVGSRVHHEGSPFGQQLHQPPPPPQHLLPTHTDRDRSPSKSNKPSRPPSNKGASNSSGSSSSSGGSSGGSNTNSSSLPIDSSPRASSRLPQPAPPLPPPHIDSTIDLQRAVSRIVPLSSSSCSSSSSQTIPHSFYVSSMAPEHPSPARPSPHKPRPRDGVSDGGCEKRPSQCPSKPSSERPAPLNQPPTTKDPADPKPLDLSGRWLELGLSSNSFPVKMEALGSPGPRYGPLPSRELLKETLSLSPPSLPSHSLSVVSSTSSKAPERPEMISTLHSSWVVPTLTPTYTIGPSPDTQGKGSSPSVIKHKALERVLPQQRSPSCPRVGETNTTPIPSNLNPPSTIPLSPKPNNDWPKHSPNQSESSPMAGHHRNSTEKPPKATKRAETSREVSPYNKRACLENSNGHPPSHLYLPQSEAYLPHSMVYANRYLHYSIPDGMALHSLPLPGKSPAYPPPILLGSNSLYPSHLAAKHPLPYHSYAGEYLTYNSQEMAHPLMHTHTDSKAMERADQTPKSRGQGQDKPRGLKEDFGGSHRGRSDVEIGEGSHVKRNKDAGEWGGSQPRPLSSSSTSIPSKDRIVCIDLVHSDTDGESTPAANKPPLPVIVPITRGNQHQCGHGDQSMREVEREPEHQLPPQGSPGLVTRAEESHEGQSPSSDSRDQGEQGKSTLRCARTSGDCKTRDRTLGDCDRTAVDRTTGDKGDEDEEGGRRGSRRTSLTKRIANSSGYVGDRIKCVTTELYADSSKLSREQRALQRAMMRFSELELKEKECGGVCVSASAAVAGQELADRQQREREWEHCQHTARQGERGVNVILFFSKLAFILSRSLCPVVGLLPSTQQRDRSAPQGPLVGQGCDWGSKEPRRGGLGVKTEGQCLPPPAPEPPTKDTASLKPRRHSDMDKPKGKRPCKTKHISQRERERRRELLAVCSVAVCSVAVCSVAVCSVAVCSVAVCSMAVCSVAVCTVAVCSVAVCSVAVCSVAVWLYAVWLCACVCPVVCGVNTHSSVSPSLCPLQEVVLYCVENRVCEVNHRDYAGYCALHEACARGWISIVIHLLEHGADINCSAQDGTRPLHDAVENDHLDVVRVLLSYGADPTLATYSGRGLLKMTHSDSMERFLTDYFADLQGRSNDDPEIYWEFYGSAVCGEFSAGNVCDVLADPPGPEDKDRRELFEFEFSDQPLLPCYNIQVSLSQGPRNWLLLSDVLRRLRMSARSFRSSFPHMEVVTMAEAEFYRQASLSQLFSCPDELEGFQPDSKELLDLVEGSAELAALLGSNLECLDDRWDEPPEPTSKPTPNQSSLTWCPLRYLGCMTPLFVCIQYVC
uniref:BCL6 corepressor n=1 Tax=Oncorhynchus kisutch TaxID=8019 RepID=A0A8C7I668_ONCKI